MTDEELIEFGNKLIAKERTSIEIFNALRHKAVSKEQLDRVHKLVVKPEAEKKKRSPELVRKLLAANKIKLRFEYSMRSLVRLAGLVLITGGVTLFLADPVINGNTPFGWTTLAQGALLLILYSLVKYKKAYDFLLIALIGYLAIFSFELLFFGMPNDLFDAFYQERISIRGTRVNSSIALLMGYLFPFLYLAVKVLLGIFTFTAYWNHKKYDALPHDVKTELEDF